MGEQVKPTEEVKRWHLSIASDRPGEMRQKETGRYVEHTDHLAALASARAEVEALRKERDALLLRVERLMLGARDVVNEATVAARAVAELGELMKHAVNLSDIIKDKAAREPGRSGA